MALLPELLAPAGTQEQLEAALLYGADAVYLGGGELSLRAGRAFRGEALQAALTACRSRGVKLYYCLNAFPRQGQWAQVEEALEFLGECKPDALIIADAGVLHSARRLCPHIPVHLSTQANTGNAASAAFWADQGVSRVNLARELPLGQIRSIRRALRASHPALEVECFVHGALCLALSGQCLLSAWLQDRPANEGRCTQPCRYHYRLMPTAPRLDGLCQPLPSSVVVEESLRPGLPLWEVSQHWGQADSASGACGRAACASADTLSDHPDGEQGEYAAIWSPEDICLLRFLPWFSRVGVDSLKIEGRMRTGGYVAHAVDVYRSALNSLRQAGQTAATLATPDMEIAKNTGMGLNLGVMETELRNTATRALGTGFFVPRRQCRNVTSAAVVPSAQHVLPLLARVEKAVGPQSLEISVRGRWEADKDVTLIIPHMHRPVLTAGSYRLENSKGERVDTVHSGTKAVLHCDALVQGVVRGVYIRA